MKLHAIKYHNRINKTENSVVASFYFPWAINQALPLSSVTEMGDDKRPAFPDAELKSQPRKQAEFYSFIWNYTEIYSAFSGCVRSILISSKMRNVVAS